MYFKILQLRLILISFWNNGNKLFLAQLKNNSFPSHPPTAHESICFHFCTTWRTLVYDRRSNLNNKALLVFLVLCSHWYCAGVLHFAISFFFLPTSYDIFIMLFILFLNKNSWKKCYWKILFNVCLNICVKGHTGFVEIWLAMCWYFRG